jgi:hypothetical protein
MASYPNVSQNMPPLRHHDSLRVPDTTELEDLFLLMCHRKVAYHTHTRCDQQLLAVFRKRLPEP